MKNAQLLTFLIASVLGAASWYLVFKVWALSGSPAYAASGGMVLISIIIASLIGERLVRKFTKKD